MTTRSQDRDFLEEVVGIGALDGAIEWIAKNLEPEEVFSDVQLAEWAEANGYAKGEE